MDSGILLLDKREGISSAKAISEAKHKLKLKKIGHAGTLDPMATGLLVCLLGSATRLASYAEAGHKTYSGVIRLGQTSDTDDVCGEILSTSTSYPSDEQLKIAVAKLTGEIEQRPPSVSAIKVEGVRSYKLAREGQAVVLKTRKVNVKKFSISRTSESDFSFTIECSKGTYIRSLARDVGEMLSCGGILSALRREESRPFSVKQAFSLEEVSAEHIIGWENLFPHYPKVEFDDADARKLINGESRLLQSNEKMLQAMSRDSQAEKLLYSGSSGEPLGLLLKQPNGWQIGVNISKPEN